MSHSEDDHSTGGHFIAESGERISSSTPKMEDMDVDTTCGIGNFRPQWIQRWATSRTYVVLFSITGILQGSQFAYTFSVISTLEKRYAFNAKISGIIITLDEITPVLLGILVGYFGGRTHRPRMIAAGMVFFVINCFLCALPYFLYGPADYLKTTTIRQDKGSIYCTTDRPEENCEEDEMSPSVVALTCIMLANFLKGFGNIAYHTIGNSFLDDSVKKTNTPLYFGYSIAMRFFGPIVGFLMSAWFLRYYENPLVDPGFGPKDPRWIGAWWIGFVVQGTLLLLITIPLMLFPRRLRRHQSNITHNEQNSIKETILGMFKTLGRLLKNPLYVMVTLSSISSPVFMYFTVLPKYVENRFHVSSADASIFSGPPGIVAYQISTLIGGYFTWKWRPTARKVALLTAISHLLLLITYMGLMIPTCKSRFDEGLITPNGLNLVNECNKNCDCSTDVMAPVCGPDGKTSYYSPCFAGCSATTFENSTQTFQNCSCILDSDNMFAFLSQIDNGFCLDDDCTRNLIIFISSFFVISVVCSSWWVGHEILLLRSMDPADKSAGLGLFETAFSGIGNIPLPILYGSLIDSTCLVWESKCGEKGNCWVYDLDMYSRKIHGASAVMAGMCFIGFCTVAKLSYKSQPLYEETDDVKSDENNGKSQKENNVENTSL